MRWTRNRESEQSEPRKSRRELDKRQCKLKMTLKLPAPEGDVRPQPGKRTHPAGSPRACGITLALGLVHRWRRTELLHGITMKGKGERAALRHGIASALGLVYF